MIKTVESWYRLEPTRGRDVVFVLDASGAHPETAQQTARFVNGLAELSEVDANWRFVFLGGSSDYPGEQFASRHDVWFHDNAGRLSIIGPVLEMLENTSDAVVVISRAEIFDIEDWTDSPLVKRMHFVKLGANPITNGFCDELLPTPELIFEMLNQKAVRLELGRPGQLPTHWDGGQFTLNDRLCLETAETDTPGLIVRFAAVDGAEPNAVAYTESGDKFPVPLVPVSPPTAAPENWQTLPQDESEIVRNCLEGRQYRCPFCHDTHKSNQLLCTARGESRESFVLLSLSELDHSGWILFQRKGAKWIQARPHVGQALMLNNGDVVMFDTKARLFHYIPEGNEWRENVNGYRQFEEIEVGEIYAVAF